MIVETSNKKRKVETVADLIKPSKKYYYKCYCSRCHGKKIDSRTQEKHTKNKSLWKSTTSRKNQENAIKARKKNPQLLSQLKQTYYMMHQVVEVVVHH
jgi:hypothetical protein